MKRITEHLLDKDDRQPTLQAGDDYDRTDPAGVHTVYTIGGMDARPFPETCPTDPRAIDIHFQIGPVPENGINGVTQEALLAIVIDRLRGFQAGPYPCAENALALRCCEGALEHLKARTRRRRERGVEGVETA